MKKAQIYIAWIWTIFIFTISSIPACQTGAEKAVDKQKVALEHTLKTAPMPVENVEVISWDDSLNILVFDCDATALGKAMGTNRVRNKIQYWFDEEGQVERDSFLN